MASRSAPWPPVMERIVQHRSSFASRNFRSPECVVAATMNGISYALPRGHVDASCRARVGAAALLWSSARKEKPRLGRGSVGICNKHKQPGRSVRPFYVKGRSGAACRALVHLPESRPVNRSRRWPSRIALRLWGSRPRCDREQNPHRKNHSEDKSERFPEDDCGMPGMRSHWGCRRPRLTGTTSRRKIRWLSRRSEASQWRAKIWL
jgi:hypothetical protein